MLLMNTECLKELTVPVYLIIDEYNSNDYNSLSAISLRPYGLSEKQT